MRDSDVAFDISIDGERSEPSSGKTTFDDFVASHGASLARSLHLACDNPAVAEQAVNAALVRTAQRWRRQDSHDSVPASTFHAGLAHADKTLSKQGPLSMNEATGGYVRGLSLEVAVAALPLQQRAALVMAHYLRWTDEQVAAGFGDRIDAVSTRRTRGVSFIAHHLRVDDDEARDRIVELLASQAELIRIAQLGPVELRRTARRRTLRNRIGTALAAVAVIAGGAGAVQVASRDVTPVDPGPQPIAAPSTSIDWLAPVADGQGGFVALNTSGSSEFAKSVDGETWFEASIWNSRAVDLRTEVTSFRRSGDRYIATIEAAESIRTVVPPRIATSENLRDWTVTELAIDLPQDVEGLRSRTRVLTVVAAGSKLMAAVEIDEIVDYSALGIGRQDVCLEVDFDALRGFYLCDGEIVTVSRSAAQVAASTVFVLSENGGPFETVSVPFGSNALSLASFGGRFVVADQASGQLSISEDGRTWVAQDGLALDRFALVSGRSDGRAVVVQPSPSGWGSAVIGGEGGVAFSGIDLALDPATVWTKPQLAAGPAGWALFVTTSRPWERADATPGWAVDTGSWIVSRLPDSATITAQDQLRLSTYRFNEASDAMQVADDGSITLTLPDVGRGEQEFIEVSRTEIDRSRSDGTTGEVKAQVFFSEDGRTWRTIWETTQDTWFASVAVGDDEVLISGTTLMSSPISVPLQ